LRARLVGVPCPPTLGAPSWTDDQKRAVHAPPSGVLAPNPASFQIRGGTGSIEHEGVTTDQQRVMTAAL